MCYCMTVVSLINPLQEFLLSYNRQLSGAGGQRRVRVQGAATKVQGHGGRGGMHARPEAPAQPDTPLQHPALLSRRRVPAVHLLALALLRHLRVLVLYVRRARAQGPLQLRPCLPPRPGVSLFPSPLCQPSFPLLSLLPT